MKGKGKPKHVKHHAKHEKKHHEEENHYNKGGAVKHHKAHGGKAHHRLDKKSRGGKTMSPSSPLSGAEPKAHRSGFGKNKVDKEMD